MHFYSIPRVYYRYLGTRGNTASLSVYLKQRRDKRKHHIPTCSFKGKNFNQPHFRALRPLFISLDSSFTQDGLSSPLPYLTMHQRSSQIACGLIPSVLFANTESMCFMVCPRPIENNPSKYLLVLRPGCQLAQSPKSFRVICCPQSTEVLRNSDSYFVWR